MKLDGVPPGVAPSSEFHSHIAHRDLDEPPDTKRCGENQRSSSHVSGGSGGWMPSPQRTQDLKLRDCTSPQDNDRPPMSVVVVRGMPPLPYTPASTSTPERPGSHWEPAVARSNNSFNGSNASLHHAGSEQMKVSVTSSFRLQPRTPTVTRSNRGGCRGRKRTAGGMLNLGGNAAVPMTFRPGCAMTVNSQHPSDESANASRTDLYPEVGLGLVGGCSHLTNTDVAVTPCSSEPRSPHVLDSALITLRSLSIRSPGGPSSPSLHDVMNTPNSIKRPRGSSFSVYTSSPAGSLPSASSTRPSTTCNSARSSPRVVPLTVLMADSSCSSAHYQQQQQQQQIPSGAASNNEIKTPSRPPFLGLKLARDSAEKQHPQSRLLDKRSAAVSFESPLSTNGFGTSPSTPLPRITLTPRSSSTSRESSFPVFPSPACLDFDDEHRHHRHDDDDDDDDDDGLPKFWLEGASPIIAPTPSSFAKKQASVSLPPLHDFESMMPRASPRSERETLVAPPPLKYPLAAASKFQHYGSSNSLALSADGSQDLNGPQQQHHHQLHMSPMDDTRPYTNSFLPFPHWLDSNHTRSIRGIQESVPGSTDLPTPQHSNSGKRPSFPFGIEEEEEPMFGVKSQSLLTGPSLLSAPRHLLVHPTMFEPEVVNYSMDADTGSLSDSEDDEPFLLVSPKEIAEERFMAKRARLRRRWVGDSRPSDNAMGSRKLSMSSEGASNTSLFGMDIPQDEPSMSRLINPNSVSATSFPSHAEDASEPSSLSRRRSDGSLGSLGLSLEILSANANPFHSTTLHNGGCTGRDLVTPPILPTSKATELSPPPFAPKQDPMLVFAQASRNNNKSGFMGRADRPSVVARIPTAADCQGPLYDGGVNDDDEDETCDHHSMDEG